jgi:hypothetical protein
MPQATLAAPTDTDFTHLRLGGLDLKFSVSRDEVHVYLKAHGEHGEIDLGLRKHNYLLLTLARRRLEDSERGLPETSCGWLDLEDLQHDPSMATPQLNVDVFRVREHFAKAGILDAAAVIERRPGELRIGTGRLFIATL